MEEKKKRKAVYDYEAQKKYRQSEKFKQISLSFTNDDYKRYKAYADSHGLKFRKLIILAIEEKIERG